MGLTTWVQALTGWLRRASAAAAANGLTDELVRDAYWLAKQAAEEYLSGPIDATKRAELESSARAFVLKALITKGVPESIARFALEYAVQILKRERVRP